ncbi:PITH domain-containing protein 1 isoform X1 [Paramisgurnus dabryanus]|uniref:PITH domain-containing protein 1 isoform X1 n=1 Tax=Paramisgurnus dabryanus TaxID=90735 RepID=UPI0031F3F1EE
MLHASIKCFNFHYAVNLTADGAGFISLYLQSTRSDQSHADTSQEGDSKRCTSISVLYTFQLLQPVPLYIAFTLQFVIQRTRTVVDNTALRINIYSRDCFSSLVKSSMSGHGHGHGGHSHGCCECEHEPAERGVEYELYKRIDIEKLQCLNESRDGDGKLVFKPWDQRTDRTKFVESDADEELLFNIPFTGNVKLKGIIISGEDDESHPAEIRLFKNIPQMSFDDTSREPDQAFRLNRDPLAELEYPTKIARFSNVQQLSIHISHNFGAESTRVFYIGLRGEYSEAHRHEITICNYEAAANPADHKVETITPQTQFIS